MRAVKYYPPETRRYLQENLQCIYCGNTNAFYMDLRLKQEVIIGQDNTLLVKASPATQKIFRSIGNNISKVLDNEKDAIHCANCQNQGVDLQERLLDYCWQVGCPGCDICGTYIDKQELVDTCTECIRENNGMMEEEECSYACAYFQDGLGAVRDYYNISFAQLKTESGY